MIFGNKILLQLLVVRIEIKNDLKYIRRKSLFFKVQLLETHFNTNWKIILISETNRNIYRDRTKLKSYSLILENKILWRHTQIENNPKYIGIKLFLMDIIRRTNFNSIRLSWFQKSTFHYAIKLFGKFGRNAKVNEKVLNQKWATL